MARLPFNPAALPDLIDAPARRPDTATPLPPLTVTQATELIKRALADATPATVRIVGEVSNFSERGHWFFSLKDEQCVISCAMWAHAAGKCVFTPQRGQQVVATGRLDYYGPQGRLQLYVANLEPVGQGILEMRFRRLCEELRRAGYFDESRKRPMPRFPQHLVVVTSIRGAAVQDVIRTARQRWAGIQLSVFDVRVQGEGAAEEIARVVTLLSEQHARRGIDAVILTRGGGSLEDLWAFNERIVADAVLRSRVPIAVGVGHEVDTTIAELVADLRCSTPTQAAERLVPEAIAEQHRVDQTAHRITLALRRCGERARAQLDGVANHPFFRRPAERLVELGKSLDHAEHRLTTALRQRVANSRRRTDEIRHVLACLEPVTRLAAARDRLAAAQSGLTAAAQRRVQLLETQLTGIERQLQGVGPRSVLARGYSYTTDVQGKLIRSAKQTAAGDQIVTHLHDGRVTSQVLGDSTTASASKPATRPRPRRRAPASMHATLFE